MLDLSILQLRGLITRMTGLPGYRPNPEWTAEHEMALLDLIKMELAAKILAGEDVPASHPTAEVFGTSTCPYCDRAKELLDKHNIPHVFKNIDEDEEAFDQLAGRIKSWKTVPQIFLGPDHVGGYDCLVARLEVLRSK